MREKSLKLRKVELPDSLKITYDIKPKKSQNFFKAKNF